MAGWDCEVGMGVKGVRRIHSISQWLCNGEGGGRAEGSVAEARTDASIRNQETCVDCGKG